MEIATLRGVDIDKTEKRLRYNHVWGDVAEWTYFHRDYMKHGLGYARNLRLPSENYTKYLHYSRLPSRLVEGKDVKLHSAAL